MSQKNLPKRIKDALNSALVVALIALIGTIITAYFGYLSNVKPTELSISATQSAIVLSVSSAGANSPITYLPIENKDELIQSFKLEGSGARVNLKFIASKFGLDFNFSAPLDMKCSPLQASLINHFALEKHISVDMSQFPTRDSNEYWLQKWSLMLNDDEVDPCSDQTLRDMAVTDGDLIHFKVGWTLIGPITLVHAPWPWEASEPPPTEVRPFPTDTPRPFIRPPVLFP